MSNRPKRVDPTPARLQARQNSESESQRARWLIWAGLGVILVIAIVIGVAVAQTNTSNDEGIATGFAETFGDPLPLYDGTGNAVGLAAPSMRAQSVQTAEVIDVDIDDGTVRAIGFFAHWCPHCQDEVPRVVDWLSSNELPDGVEVVAVSTSVDEGAPNYPPAAWFDREDWPDPVLADSDEDTIANAYGLAGFPYWVLVAGDGTVIERRSGELTEAEFTAMIDQAAASL
ncbi:MAG: TlpA family protein disulfide reductase [Acidimicrobiales bacterium]